MTSQALGKQIVNRIRRAKCQQPKCKSNGSECQQIVVFGSEEFKKKGIMCSSCFIDSQLIAQIGNVQHHAISIQKFMKVLTQEYNLYAKQKMKEDWAPNVYEEQKSNLKQKIINLQKQTQKGIMEVMKYLEDASNKAFTQAKNANHDDNFQRLHELLTEEDEDEQDRINITQEIKQIVSRLQVEQGMYKFSNEDSIRKQNEKIISDFKAKVTKAKSTIVKLIEIHQKCIKYLIQ